MSGLFLSMMLIGAAQVMLAPMDAILENIKNVVTKISSSKPVMAHLMQQENIKVVGALNDLESGYVNFFE